MSFILNLYQLLIYLSTDVKVVMHEALCAVFFHVSVIASTLKPVLFKLTKMLCSKAKLKEDSELPVLKLVCMLAFSSILCVILYQLSVLRGY